MCTERLKTRQKDYGISSGKFSRRMKRKTRRKIKSHNRIETGFSTVQMTAKSRIMEELSAYKDDWYV